MSQNFPNSRREFLKLTAAGLATTPLAGFAEEKKSASSYEFCTFTKPLQHLSYDEMAMKMAAIGFDGIEAPVRPGGHVLPEKVEDDLPKMMEALKAHNLNLTVLTSGINEVSDEQRTEAVLKTAAELGVKRYRMAYYRYDLDKPIRPQLDEFRPKLKDLISLSSELGIKPVYQNHSGKNYFGAPMWDLGEVFGEYDPSEIGVAFDIGHATVEGAKAWPLDFAMIEPYIDTVYVKEPQWNDNQLSWGPLGEGAVDKGFYNVLKKSSFDGPISLHVEYLDHKNPEIEPQLLKALEENFATLKSLLG